MLRGKNILVTGGAGFIGSNLLVRLKEEGCQLRATYHKTPPIITNEDIEYVQADLTLLEDCQRVVQDMDYVFMCAANTSGAAVITRSPLVHVTPNVVMNAQILDAAYQAKVQKFIFISSSIVYPSTGSHPSIEESWLKEDPYECYFGAGWMKRYSEILCKTYSEKIKDRMATIVVRPSNIYGPYDKFDIDRSHMTASLIRKVAEGHDPLDVWGTGEDIRDLIYVDDFIDGLLLATRNISSFDPINIASGKGYRVKDILQTLLGLKGGKSPRIQFDHSKPSTIPVRIMDVKKAQRLLGFSAKTNLENGLNKTLNWYSGQATKNGLKLGKDASPNQAPATASISCVGSV